MSKIINNIKHLTTFVAHKEFFDRAVHLSTLELFLMFLLLTIQSCGVDVEDPTPLSQPQWVQKSLPREWPERGIDAHESGGIFIEWKLKAEEDIVAYNIYRAIWYDVNDSLGSYELLTRLEAESNTDLKYIDKSALEGIQYYYALKSMGVSANMSEFSNSLFYSLLQQHISERMTPNGLTAQLGENRKLRWIYGYEREMEDYCLTVLTYKNELISRDIIMPGNYTSGDESWQIPVDVVLDSGSVYQWRIEGNAKYIDGRETAGSESSWATFLYLGF